uniref:hypothetical protein n=1 Tax=Carnobacterium TaxID=2747 RepID=UPI00344F6954
MSLLPYVLLLEVTKENEVLVYNANNNKEYRFNVSQEHADRYKVLLEEREEDEEILLDFDEETGQIGSIDE